MNGTYQLAVYANGINLLGDNINTIKKKTEAVTDASKETGLELTHSLALKMEVTCSSEISVDFEQPTQIYTPEYRTPHNHCSTLKMELTCSSKISVDFQQTTWCRI
jgi:hypothetical protein